MIGTKTRGILLSALALGALGLGGCATKKYVNEQVGVVDTRVSAHETKLGELDQTSRDALERATAAGKLAEGKFMYSVVMSDDALKFPIGKASLSPEGQERLTAVAERLKGENKNVYLEIQGYTDSTGTPEHNDQLGEQRAEAVRRFLNRQGVALNRMATISYGQEQPVASNYTPEGRSQNRRVTIVVLA